MKAVCKSMGVVHLELREASTERWGRLGTEGSSGHSHHWARAGGRTEARVLGKKERALLCRARTRPVDGNWRKASDSEVCLAHGGGF